MEKLNSSIDPKNGFCSESKVFHSLRPPAPLPPETAPFSAASYAFSLQAATSPCPDKTALISSATGKRLLYSDFIEKTKTLSASLQNLGVSKGDTAFILSPNSIHVPILYFSLLSLGVIISPANPTSTESEIHRQIKLSKPIIAFASSTTWHKLPTLRYGPILIDSLQFESMLKSSSCELGCVEVSQSDVAAILYSSGTTGQVKGVMLTHRNLIAVIANKYYAQRQERTSPTVQLHTVPYFHAYGFYYSLKSVALSETVVVIERFDLRKMLRAVEEYSVTHVALAPPVVVAVTKGDQANGYDLSSLEEVHCGGAPLGREMIAAFTEKFPLVLLLQGYALTESTSAAFLQASPEESLHWGSVGRLVANCEAKIVDPNTGVALPPFKHGELWIKGPNIMKGYIGDPMATSETLVSDGWLRTGDLCYFDEEAFLFVVDRLKELIKYKGYQVPPAELEQLLLSHPEIVDAAVIPYPDEEAGQLPMAFVVRHSESSLDEGQVMGFIAKQVAPYKKIRRVAFVSSIPKSAAGKILRKELRSIAIQGTSSKL